jgi:hypothetical protein
MNVLRLEKSFSGTRLEAACARANQVGAFQYANIKSILEKNLDQVALPPDSPPLPNHDNVRGPGYYTREETPCAN